MDDRIKSGKQFAEFASELLDTEVAEAYRIIISVRNRYHGRANTPENLEMLRDEVITKLAEVGVLATLDPAPCLYGEPPIIEILGKIAGHADHKYGFDHEKKGYEVNKANARDEDYLGQKERADTRKVKE